MRVPEAFGQSITFDIEFAPTIEKSKRLGFVLMTFDPSRRERQRQESKHAAHTHQHVKVRLAGVKGPMAKGRETRLITVEPDFDLSVSN
jgi:hypothetical protein